MSGWISLHRKIRKSWISDNAEYFKAWIFILLEVNHADAKALIDGELIECKRGQSLNSVSTWAEIFGKGWTRQRVRTFFKLLEKDQKVNQEGLRKTTRLSVCNYETYQSKQPTDNPQNNPQITTNNNDNNKQLNSTDESEDEKVKFSEWDMKIAERYLEVSLENNPNSASLKKVNINKWSEEVRKLREIDGYPEELIADVCRFALNDDFWKVNAVSIASIRGKGKNGLPKFENIMNKGIEANIIKRGKYEKLNYAE